MGDFRGDASLSDLLSHRSGSSRGRPPTKPKELPNAFSFHFLEGRRTNILFCFLFFFFLFFCFFCFFFFLFFFLLLLFWVGWRTLGRWVRAVGQAAVSVGRRGGSGGG